jgi:hypothetical protein
VAAARRTLALLGVLLGALLACPAGSFAALSITVATTPAAVELGVHREITYSVQIIATGRTERFAFGFRTPRFAVTREGPVEGAPLKFTGQTLDLRGGTLLGPASVGIGTPACAPDVPAHGGDFEARSWDVEVAPNRPATAVLTFAILPVAPWPQTSYGMDFTALRTLNSHARGTLDNEVVVRAGGPLVSGPRGVHIRLASSPRAGLAAQAGNPVVRRGRSVTIRGSTQPRLPNTPLRLTIKRFAPGGGKVSRRSERVRTDGDGRFSRRVLLRRGGTYAIGATYRTTRPDLVSDYACPLGFRVR